MPGYRIMMEKGALVYTYDGSMPGFYCCVHQSIYSHTLPLSIEPEAEAKPTFLPQRKITTNMEKAKRVRASVEKEASARARELVETIFLSCLENKELALLRFLLVAYAEGRRAVDMITKPEVHALLKAERNLLGENHLLTGFLRFSDYDGTLAACISPRNFVLPFLGPHFIDRYPNENFMIFDKTHKAALLYQNKQAQIVRMEDVQLNVPSEEEERYRSLWKQFYKTVSIEARENPKCRMTHMPKRYWANMVEMQELL